MDTRAKVKHESEGACGSRSEPQAGGFGRLARRIATWTTNLLATAIVLAAGLAMGWQVLAWWHERPQPEVAAPLPELSLPAIAESREFWTRGGPLRIERVHGDAVAAQAAMREFCRQGSVLQSEAAAGPGEAQFVASLTQQTPLETAGEIDLYLPPGQTAMVVAVSRSSRRIVSWSLSAQRGEGEWSLFHFRPQAPSIAGSPWMVPRSLCSRQPCSALRG